MAAFYCKDPDERAKARDRLAALLATEKGRTALAEAELGAALEKAMLFRRKRDLRDHYLEVARALAGDDPAVIQRVERVSAEVGLKDR